MSCSAVLRIQKGDPSLDYKSLLGASRAYKRSSMSVRESAREITFTIEASDATALRASVNSVLRDIKIVEGAATAPIPQKRKK